MSGFEHFYYVKEEKFILENEIRSKNLSETESLEMFIASDSSILTVETRRLAEGRLADRVRPVALLQRVPTRGRHRPVPLGS